MIRLKKTSKAFIAVILIGYIIVLIGVSSIGYLVFAGLENEALLDKEFEELDYLINNYDLDNNNIDRKLNSYVTEDDYLVVERAIKNYWKEVVKNCRRLDDIYENYELYLVLSFSNFYIDAPNFTSSLNIIDASIANLEEVKNNLLYLYDKDTIISYIENYNLDQYFIDYYKDLMIDEEVLKTSIKEIENSINYSTSALQIYDELFLLLQKNQHLWYLGDDGYIYFDDDNLLNEYNRLIYLIENIDFSNTNIEQNI